GATLAPAWMHTGAIGSHFAHSDIKRSQFPIETEAERGAASSCCGRKGRRRNAGSNEGIDDCRAAVQASLTQAHPYLASLVWAHRFAAPGAAGTHTSAPAPLPHTAPVEWLRSVPPVDTEHAPRAAPPPASHHGPAPARECARLPDQRPSPPPPVRACAA